MGEVWLAHDTELEIHVALKLLLPRLAAAEGAVAFMKNECRAARGLTHPGIVRIHDFHPHDHLAFISMEWVEGPTFDRWDPPSGDKDEGLERARVLRRVAGALDHIHLQGLVHRDVKARNILMTPEGQPKLTDFGIVGLWRFQPGILDIQSGGSHASMSPQQREGQPPHPADDIYAFGVLLHDALSGVYSSPPPRAAAGMTDTQPPAGDQPPRPTTPAGEHLLQLAARMRAPARSDRPASMRAVRRTIDAVLEADGGYTLPPDADPIAATDPPSASAAGRIAPRAYTPADQKTPGAPRRRPVLWALVLIIGAFGLMAAGIALIGVLTRPPGPTLTTAEPAPPSAEVRPSPVAPAESTADAAALKETPPPADLSLTAAEKNMAQWLQTDAQLKAAQVGAWAPEELQAVETRAAEADTAMIANAYDRAAESYAAAVAAGKSLLAQREPRYATAMAQGARAIQADLPAEARQHFDRALAIKPDDADARKGLAAADRRDKVLTLMATGQAHEIEARYELALADYEAALGLENDFAPARAAVDRLKDQIAEGQYNHLVSEGLAAYYGGRLQEARRHIQAALQYRPAGQEAREALRQIETAAREQRIAGLRRQGQAAESKEQWDRALEAYEKALAIDPALQFAHFGAARSRERIQLDKRLRYYLDHPETLASDRYLEEAQRLLTSVETLSPRGPRLTAQIQTLKAGVRAARTLVPVTLVSDGQTEIAVLRVARLGRITSQTLELRPGIYTVVGARNGYKDVRQTIRVEADQQALQVSIACKEKI
jgi:serine/threonine protein kinase/tetratricopeptide (TPR) repeat protein